MLPHRRERGALTTRKPLHCKYDPRLFRRKTRKILARDAFGVPDIVGLVHGRHEVFQRGPAYPYALGKKKEDNSG